MDLTERLNQLNLLRERWSPPNERRAALRRAHAAWANAGIEGNPIPWPAAKQLLMTDAPSASEGGASGEIRGCYRALEFMETIQAPLLISHIRQLHALVMEGLAAESGVLRSKPVTIVKQSGPDAGRAVFKPPHPARIPELIEALLVETAGADGENPALLSGRFHYEFQSIHPFSDGNGRVGRILSTWLGRRGWNGAGFYLAPAIARAGSAYYLALRAVRPDYESDVAEGLLPWLMPFCEMFEDALRSPDASATEENES